MAKTKEISVNCTDVQISPNGNRMVTVSMEEPDIDDLLTEIPTDDLIAYVSKNMGPEEIFSQTELEKWAESEGYIKPETQND